MTSQASKNAWPLPMDMACAACFSKSCFARLERPNRYVGGGSSVEFMRGSLGRTSFGLPDSPRFPSGKSVFPLQLDAAHPDIPLRLAANRQMPDARQGIVLPAQ